MAHVDKNERRRQNGQERDSNGNIGNKSRAERYRNNYTNNKKNNLAQGTNSKLNDALRLP